MKLPWTTSPDNVVASLVGSEWKPAENALAVFFGASKLSGVFAKNVMIPPGVQAYLFQEGKSAAPLPAGEHNLQNFFERVGGLFNADTATRVLITRIAPLSISIDIKDVLTLERLGLQFSLTYSVSIADPEMFQRRFLLQPGTVTTDDVDALMRGSIEQALRRQVIGQSIEAWEGEGEQLSRSCRTTVEKAISATAADLKLGIGCDRVELNWVMHPLVEEIAKRRGEVWLIGKRKELQQGEQLRLADAYRQQAFEELARKAVDDEVATARRIAEREQQQVETQEQLADLQFAVDTAERRLNLASRILEAESKAQVRDAATRQLISELAAKQAIDARATQSEEEAWLHTQELAKIEGQQALNEKRLLVARSLELSRIEGEHQLLMLRIRNEAEQARYIENEQDRIAEKERQQGLQQHDDELLRMLKDAAGKAQAVRIELEIQREVVAADRERRKGDDADDLTKMTNLLALRQKYKADKLKNWVDQQNATFELESKKRALQMEEVDRKVEQDLRAQNSKQSHELAMADKAIERLVAIGSLSDMGKLATADPENARLLAEVMKSMHESQMKPDALLARAAATSPAAAAAMQAVFASMAAVPAPQLAQAGALPASDALALQQGMWNAMQTQRERDDASRREHELKLGEQKIRELQVIVGRPGGEASGMAAPIAAAMPGAGYGPAAAPLPATTVNVNVPTNPATTPAVSPGKFCPACRGLVAHQARFCSHCGHPLA